jgi:hypothetical protein
MDKVQNLSNSKYETVKYSNAEQIPTHIKRSTWKFLQCSNKLTLLPSQEIAISCLNLDVANNIKYNWFFWVSDCLVLLIYENSKSFKILKAERTEMYRNTTILYYMIFTQCTRTEYILGLLCLSVYFNLTALDWFQWNLMWLLRHWKQF